MQSPIPFFTGLSDPRIDRTKDHLFEDIIFIAIAAVICGADTWTAMEEFAKAKLSWLKTFLKLSEGVPSHDTFNRVFSLLDPTELETGFIQWTCAVAQITDGEVVSIDGKSICGSRSKDNKSMVGELAEPLFTWSALGQASIISF
jgi:hypothetical protein